MDRRVERSQKTVVVDHIAAFLIRTTIFVGMIALVQNPTARPGTQDVHTYG